MINQTMARNMFITINIFKINTLHVIMLCGEKFINN
ncbi:hypothetical protein SPAB_03322 [Salmonella enterica subsp. enterica serovar Paratyphi B str. SPB7]|uniref:Uncharacterized protein n=1 Tax=Salmonella paratyphi B (strain ATCC BAA-1250 / SPB7) TaxID=1016998 RepID=A0A6C6Z4C6_SALPB|nr:hypothetical protein SPAB_03322 [Salmonella enterica subsp. enterica serovar Paratyphi B str. SPB7]